MATLPLLRRKASSFLRLSPWTQAWFIPCWLLLGLAKAAIFSVSFKRLAPRFGESLGVNAWVPLTDAAAQQRARMIGHLVRMTARYTPWNSNCFPQAVVARLLLGLYKIPYALYFGLTRDPGSGEMKAHAWVVSGPVAVTGGHSFGQFTVVGCYVAGAPVVQGL